MRKHLAVGREAPNSCVHARHFPVGISYKYNYVTAAILVYSNKYLAIKKVFETENNYKCFDGLVANRKCRKSYELRDDQCSDLPGFTDASRLLTE